MKMGWMIGAGLLLVTLGVAGCAKPSDSATSGKSKATAKGAGKKVEHVHGKGPHEGVIFDLGRHHAEFTVNHDTKECTIFILGDDEKTPTPVAAKELTLNTKATKTKDGKTVAPMTIKLLPKDESGGKATRYVGTDPGLGNVADFAGTVVAEIDGKPSQGDFKEDEHDDHKPEKK